MKSTLVVKLLPLSLLVNIGLGIGVAPANLLEEDPYNMKHKMSKSIKRRDTTGSQSMFPEMQDLEPFKDAINSALIAASLHGCPRSNLTCYDIKDRNEISFTDPGDNICWICYNEACICRDPGDEACKKFEVDIREC